MWQMTPAELADHDVHPTAHAPHDANFRSWEYGAAEEAWACLEMYAVTVGGLPDHFGYADPPTKAGRRWVLRTADPTTAGPPELA